MTVTNTSLLGLALPTTGTESGVWGDDVNNGLTILVDMSVAGTNNITQDSDITLAVSNGNNSSSFTSTATNSTVAQYYVLNCSGARTALRNIIVPTTSKTYVVTNGTTGGFGITVKKFGGTGVSVAAGETAIVFYNTVTGDVAKVSSTVNVSSFSAGTTGFTPSTATTGAVTLAGTLATTNGGTGLTSFTANGVVYASSTSALATGSVLSFDGQTLANTRGSPVVNLVDTGSSNSALRFVSSGGISYIQSGVSGSSFAPVVFTSNGGGTEIARFNSSGYLGIGTSSPTQPVQLTNNQNGSTWLNVVNTNSGSGAASGVLFTNNTGDYGAISLLSSSNIPANSLFIRTLSTNPLTFGTNNTEQMRLDSSGNLGLGVTPSAWSSIKAIELPNGVALGAFSASAAPNAYLVTNAFFNGTNWIYKINGAATEYTQTSSGYFAWFNAPSGTAGNAITFTQAMTLDASGNLGVGWTSPAARADVRASNIAIGVTALASAQGQAFVGTTDGWGQNIGGTLALGGAQNSGTLTQTFASISGRRESALGYIYTGYLQLAVSDGANMVEAVRISSNKAVGINNTNPSYPLDVSGTTRIDAGSSSNAYGLLVQGNGTGQMLLSVQDSGTSLYQQVSFNYCKQAGANYPLFEVIPYYNQPLLTWGGTLGTYAGVLGLNNPLSGYPITFSIGTSEKMRIDSGGNLLVGTTTTVSGSNHIVVGSNSIQGSKTNFSNLSTAQSFGFSATNAGVYVANMKSVSGASVAFLISVVYNNSSLDMYTTSLGNCTAGGNSGTITAINGDARIYTFSRNGGDGLLYVSASTTATGTTTIYLTPLNVFA